MGSSNKYAYNEKTGSVMKFNSTLDRRNFCKTCPEYEPTTTHSLGYMLKMSVADTTAFLKNLKSYDALQGLRKVNKELRSKIRDLENQLSEVTK